MPTDVAPWDLGCKHEPVFSLFDKAALEKSLRGLDGNAAALRTLVSDCLRKSIPAEDILTRIHATSDGTSRVSDPGRTFEHWVAW